MIRVLHVMGSLDRGGLENFIMNIYRSIDRNKIQFDFLIHVKKECAFEKEVLSLGGRVFRIEHVKNIGIFKYKKNLKKFFEINKYKIIHSHYNEINGIILKVAKEVGIEKRISHSHTAYPKQNFLENILKKYSKNMINSSANFKLACSQNAGQWLYSGEKFKVLNNGIDLKKFSFNKEKKDEIRKKLNINEDSFVIGHVGNFIKVKNHKFLLDIVMHYKEQYENIKLVLIGEGPLEKEIKDKAKELGIDDYVLFLGTVENVNEYLNIFDVIVFPSIYEGLPVSLVEAQANGIPCVISNNITKEIELGEDLISFCSLNEDLDFWCREIKSKNRKVINDENFLYDYDIKNVEKELSKIYLE